MSRDGRTVERTATSGRRAAPAVTAVAPTARCTQEEGSGTGSAVHDRTRRGNGTNGDDADGRCALEDRVPVLAVIHENLDGEPYLAGLELERGGVRQGQRRGMEKGDRS